VSQRSRTNRWRGTIVLTLGAAGTGLVAKRPLVILLAAIGIAYAVYPAIAAVPRPRLELDRRISDENPRPGATVEVAATVTNIGERPLLDLRLVDGVPPALAVTEGSPRLGTVLTPGGSATIRYTITARRGQHRFAPLTAIVRDLSGAHELELSVAEETSLVSRDSRERLPPSVPASQLPGHQAADTGGSGTEFHQTRAYVQGDPMGRVDWNRFARTGELATVEFRAERADPVLIMIDVTPSAYRGRPDAPHAVATSVGAARRMVVSVLAEHNRVGLAAVGREAAWLAPRSGHSHRLETQRLLTTHAAFDPRPPPADAGAPLEEQAGRLLVRLSEQSHLVVLSPLLDQEFLRVIQRLQTSEHTVSVISPNVTVRGQGDDGRALAVSERRDRLRRLRDQGAVVVDWEPERPLAAAVERHLKEGLS
jgi:uncharacterized protein (DUF58 family)